jgi:glycosyltransferase involved in cell wall biosynthesis
LLGLTAIVITQNEEENIGECLESVRFADEIMVVDSFSTDSTPDIALRHGARLLQHQYVSLAAQRNWAIPQASHDWVLILDADERVTPELREEMVRVLRAPGRDGYEMKRRNFFLGREIRHSGWQNDWVLRLFPKAKGRYPEKHAHERLVIDGRTARLRGRLLHYSYRTMDDYWRKLERYAEWNAMDAAKRGARVSRLYALLHPPLRFLKAYLLQGGFLDGRAGLTLCLLTAKYAAAKDARIRELWGRAREEDGKR